MKERVQKILAQAGIASRRKCEELIAEGSVTVNGKIISLGDKADVNDKITVNNKPIVIEKKIYIMLHKPKGYVTTVTEKYEMKTVMDLINIKQRIFPIGRLDKETEGLLLFTNDGEFSNKLTHPSFEVQKEYFVVLDNLVSKDVINELKKGIIIDDRKVKLSHIKVSGKEVVLSIHEGRKHIVRRLFSQVGLKVERLIRTKIKNLSLENLAVSKWRMLRPDEIKKLQST